MERIHEEEKRRLTGEMKNQVEEIENKYKNALEETMGMYKNVKRQLDEKDRAENEMQTMIKNLSLKNKDHEKVIQDLQGVLLKLRQQIVQTVQQK